jgi:hypothetical protein
MCYEFSGWYKQANAQAPEQARKDVKTGKVVTREAPAAAPEPAEPVTRIAEREKIPA